VLKHFLKITFILLMAIAIAFLIVQNFLVGLLVCLGLLLGLLIFLDLKAGLILVVFALILGQLVRIPIPGTESFFLPNDVIIPAMVLIWIFGKLVGRKFQI